MAHRGVRGQGNQCAQRVGKKVDHGVSQAGLGEKVPGSVYGELEYLPEGSRAQRSGKDDHNKNIQWQLDFLPITEISRSQNE